MVYIIAKVQPVSLLCMWLWAVQWHGYIIMGSNMQEISFLGLDLLARLDDCILYSSAMGALRTDGRQ